MMKISYLISLKNELIKLIIRNKQIIDFKSKFDSEISENNHVYNLEIGVKSYISLNSIVCNSIIGNYSSIGPNCVIGFGEHPSNYLSTSPNLYNIDLKHSNYFGENVVKIGNDVWIGANVFIKNGVIIGDGAIIGAGSVVLKDVAPFSIVVGSPAKYLRNRFSMNTIEKIKNLEWWHWSEEKIKHNSFLFESEFNDDLILKYEDLNK